MGSIGDCLDNAVIDLIVRAVAYRWPNCRTRIDPIQRDIRIPGYRYGRRIVAEGSTVDGVPRAAVLRHRS